ncbi:MAG: carbohydrate-binding domain-containing protein [Lachnospiraceae bacterium]|nr:carbohydrate-binding domain-containing protein [Lachnospiraceae bacterium]
MNYKETGNQKNLKGKLIPLAAAAGLSVVLGIAAAVGTASGALTSGTVTSSSSYSSASGVTYTAVTSSEADGSESSSLLSVLTAPVYTVTEQTTVSSVTGGIFDGSELFTSRDLVQSADTGEAVSCTVEDNTEITITEAGVYVITGSAENVTIYVDTDSESKVQIVLDNVSVTNEDMPVIYVKSADKVFVTSVGENTLFVTGTFASDGSTNTDGVIFSKDDIVLNGTGTVTISSTENGVVGKDDVKVTGGTWNITAASKAIEANDSIRIADGILNLQAGTDGLHAENDDDDALGYIYIGGGTISIQAGDDGIHANSLIQIDSGEITVNAAEGLEGTYIQVNDGAVQINGVDDGVNAANKSSAYTATFEMNGGELTVSMGSGDTDGIDSNGNIIVNGGTISVTASSTFDYDGTAEFNGGTIIVNGQEVSEIPNQMMGGMQNRSGGFRR